MKASNHLTLSTSPLSQAAKKSRETASLTRRQRLLYGRRRRYNTGKEYDTETGLYYYGARYLDSRISRWISGDPAMGEYVPGAPVSDEARKRNGNLPGQGGVFNYVNLHVYHYAGNNPVKLVDPDGETATYSVDDENKTVTINLDIVIYGKNAHTATAQEYKDRITEQWGQDSSGNSWQMDIGGEQYTVNFNVNVTVGKRLCLLKKWWNAHFGTKNFIEVDNSELRPYVENGYLGRWIEGGTPQRGGYPLMIDNIPAHETGHLLGFIDRYSNIGGRSVPHSGWGGNIMGTTSGRVEQKNIDAIGGFISGRGKRGTLRSRTMDRF